MEYENRKIRKSDFLTPKFFVMDFSILRFFIRTHDAGVEDELQTCFCGTLEPAKIVCRHSAGIVYMESVRPQIAWKDE